MILFLLAACASRTAPVLFPAPLPDVAPPEHAELEPTADACLEAVPFMPGHPAPFVENGEPTCRAQLLPELRTYELIVAEDLALYWEPVAAACYERSAADRAHAQAWFDVSWEQHLEARREARVQRILTGVAFVGGTALGLGLGAGYTRALP
jgi:hypothetical protein